MHHNYQPIKRRSGHLVHIAGGDGTPLCGFAGGAWRYVPATSQATCAKCLAALDAPSPEPAPLDLGYQPIKRPGPGRLIHAAGLDGNAACERYRGKPGSRWVKVSAAATCRPCLLRCDPFEIGRREERARHAAMVAAGFLPRPGTVIPGYTAELIAHPRHRSGRALGRAEAIDAHLSTVDLQDA